MVEVPEATRQVHVPRPADLEGLDPESRAWLDELRANGAVRDRCLGRLHELLLRAARHEANRRSDWLGGVDGPELDDIAGQAADDALLAITSKLDTFRGASRFTTWAYKFVVYQVSLKMRQHQWRDRPLPLDDEGWARLPDRLNPGPAASAEQRDLIAALRRAVEDDLTARQREVFVALVLNEVPTDALALRLGGNRNALYKTLHDARRKLRASLAEAGHALQ